MTQPPHSILIADVLAVAEGLEASAAEVYRQAAADATEQRVRETLLGLAEMEEDHLRSFHNLRERLGTVGSPAPTGKEAAALLQAWVDGELFPPAAGEAAPGKGPDTVESWLRTAVGMEKESIAFYSGLREMVEERQRPVIDHIIGEELYHLASLSYLLRALGRGRARRQRA